MTTDIQKNGLAKVKPDWSFWGLIDLNGDYVLEPMCHSIWDWKEGIARLEKVPTKMGIHEELYNGQYGFITADGTMISDFSFGYARDFSSGLAAVNKDQKWGFINKQGKPVIDCLFDNVRSFQQEGCIALLHNKWGLLDRNGKWKLDNTFDDLSEFAYGLSVATVKSGSMPDETHRFIIDKHGTKLVDLPKEWGWFKPVSEKLILIGTSSGYPGERFYGFMDLHGRIKSKPQFYTNSDSSFYTGKFVNGKLYVETKEGKKGFVNEEGEFERSDSLQPEHLRQEINLQSRPFDEVLDFSEGLAVARKGDYWGVIDETNRVAVDFIYKRRIFRTTDDTGLFFSGYFPKFSCGLIGVCEERDTIYSGYIDKDGKTRIDLTFRVAEPFYSDK